MKSKQSLCTLYTDQIATLPIIAEQSIEWNSSLYVNFVAKEEMYMRDDLHISGKGAGAFAAGLKQVVHSGLDNVRYLN